MKEQLYFNHDHYMNLRKKIASSLIYHIFCICKTRIVQTSMQYLLNNK